jgi:molybdate transport system substrate-binding protein
MRALLLVAVMLYSLPATAAEPVVAVAANLSMPMETLAADFRRTHGMAVRLNFGSSGDLLRQIQAGARYELFIAAAADYAARAAAAGVTAGAPVTLALGNMGAYIPRRSPLVAVSDLDALGRELARGNYRRIAMANPAVAPFGVAARQAMQKMGVWVVEKDRLVMGENVAQAVQFTLAGGVDVGFIPESWALLPQVAAQGRFLPIPGNWHDPLAQTMVLLRDAGPEARAFFVFLQSAEAGAFLSRAGYTIPRP